MAEAELHPERGWTALYPLDDAPAREIRAIPPGSAITYITQKPDGEVIIAGLVADDEFFRQVDEQYGTDPETIVGGTFVVYPPRPDEVPAAAIATDVIRAHVDDAEQPSLRALLTEAVERARQGITS